MTRNKARKLVSEPVRHSTVLFYLFLRVQAEQFHPRGSTVLSHVRWSKIGEPFHLDIGIQVYVLSLFVQPLSASTLRNRRRFRLQYHSLCLQVSIFKFHDEIPSLP